MNIILILFLFISVYSNPILFLRYSNGKEFDHVVLYKDYDSFPGSFWCSGLANWTIVPDLPKNMYLYHNGLSKSAEIRNKSREYLSETTYTITAITNEGNVSLSFRMEVTSCESPKLFHFRTNDEITLSYEGKNRSIYCSKWECLDPLIYDFYIPKSHYYRGIGVHDVNGTSYMNVDSSLYLESGQLDLSNTLPPQIYSDTTSCVGTKYEWCYVRIGIINRYNSVCLYPPSGSVEFMDTSVKIKYEHRHHDGDHLIVASNEHGSCSVPLHINWDGCVESNYFSFEHHSGGSVNVTNKNGEEIEMNKDGYYCTNEREFEISVLDDWPGREWNKMYPLLIYDENGLFGEFMMERFSTISFRFNVVVPNHSLLKYSFDESDSWLNEDFDDSCWLEKKGIFFGPFANDIIYFRKKFVIESIDGYNSMLIDILSYGFLRIYLNGEEMEQLEKSDYEYSRFEIPSDKIRIGNNIVCISFEKRNDPNIVFDLSIRLVTLSEWIHSMKGIVREIQEHPTGHPERAFTQDAGGSWRIESYPASLEIDFSKRNVIINRFFMERITYESSMITSIRIEGIKGDDIVNLYESERNGFMNEYDDYRLIDFGNFEGYPIYRITFLSEKNNSAMDIRNIRLSRMMIPCCEKMRNIPETYPNHVVLKSCGLFYAGKKQYICKVEDYNSEWIEDESLCLSKLPPNGESFVYFTLRLINLPYHSYNETIRDRFITMIIENSALLAKEMNLLLVYDSSSNGLTCTDLMVRVIVKRSGGDYIRDHLLDLKWNLTAIVHDYFSESLDGEFVDDIKVYTSMNVGLLIWVVIGIVSLLIIQGIEFYLIIRNRTISKSFDKKELKESLLQNENPYECLFSNKCKDLMYNIVP